MVDRCYCTVDEIKLDLYPVQTAPLDEDRLFHFVRSASEFIERRMGNFIPIIEKRYYDGNGQAELKIGMILAATAVENNDTVISASQYYLSPANKFWENGPYNRICVDPDATELSSWYEQVNAVEITGRWGYYEKTQASGATVQNTGGITSSGTSLQVENETSISQGNVLLIGSEQCLVTAHPSTNTYTIVRGCNGTTAAARDKATAISKYLLPYDINMLCRELAALAAQKAATQWAGRQGNPETGETFFITQYPKSIIDQVAQNYRIFEF